MSEPTEDPTPATPVEVQTIPVTTVTKPPSPLLRELSAEDYAAIEAAMMEGDYSKLGVPQRLALIRKKCDEEGISMYQAPFVFAVMKGKLNLISTKNRAAQLRANRNVTIEVVKEETLEALHIFKVTVKGRITKDGVTREDTDIGVVPLVNDQGEPWPAAEMGNKLMAAITKAKNRVTYSLCGVSGLDETEARDMGGWDEGQGKQALPPGPRRINPGPSNQDPEKFVQDTNPPPAAIPTEVKQVGVQPTPAPTSPTPAQVQGAAPRPQPQPAPPGATIPPRRPVPQAQPPRVPQAKAPAPPARVPTQVSTPNPPPPRVPTPPPVRVK